MAEPYIPAEDTLALVWMQAFRDGISANPALYGVSAADALAIAGAVNGFDTALAVALNPTTRTKVTVAAKDDARTSAEQICRQFATLIKYNAGISDPDKIAIGVRPVNPDRNPIEVPETSPLVNINRFSSLPGRRLTPDARPDRRRQARRGMVVRSLTRPFEHVTTCK